MKKMFEDYFSEILADMVSICLEYTGKRADVIYIYISCEGNTLSGNCFFSFGGKLFHKHKINDASVYGFKHDVSIGRQKAVLDAIKNSIQDLKALCHEYGREMPTEIKIIFDVKKNSLDAKYKYEPVFSNSPDKTDYDVFNEWFDEVSGEIT